MLRKSTWELCLAQYIEECRHKPFEYGVHDCCMFAAGAVQAVTSQDPMAEFRGKYKSQATSVRALKEIGFGDLESTIDSKFSVIEVGLAQRGDLAFYDNAIGVVVGSWAWFVSDDGLERIDRSQWAKAWSVARG